MVLKGFFTCPLYGTPNGSTRNQKEFYNSCLAHLNGSTRNQKELCNRCLAPLKVPSRTIFKGSIPWDSIEDKKVLSRTIFSESVQMTNEILSQVHEMFLKMNFFQLMEQHHLLGYQFDINASDGGSQT